MGLVSISSRNFRINFFGIHFHTRQVVRHCVTFAWNVGYDKIDLNHTKTAVLDWCWYNLCLEEPVTYLLSVRIIIGLGIQQKKCPNSLNA